MKMATIVGIAIGGGLLFYGYRYFSDKGKRLNDDQHVVIIGGGYGGARLAKLLKGRGKYTVIDVRDAMHHNMAALRASVEHGFSHKMFIPFRAAFGDNFIHGKVIEVDAKNQLVFLEDNPTPIKYTQLVIATGSTGPFPGNCSIDLNSSEMSKLYEAFVDEIQKAKNIVLVGGGPVGIEMAGEITTEYPNEKKVTIVHNTKLLVAPNLLPKARALLNQKLVTKKINTILGEAVTNLKELPLNTTTEGLVVKLSSGREIDADLVIQCFGIDTNKEAYKNSLTSSMNEKGQLKVNDYLEVTGYDNIFAIGDCNDFKVVKLAYEAGNQASLTYENLINIAKGKQLLPYKSDKFQMCVPIGRDGGFTQAGGFVLGDFVTRFVKSKDVFVKNVWKNEFGLPQP